MLGPSQISVAVHRQMPNQSLVIYSAMAHWTDYSDVYVPKAAPKTDFHGVNGMGKNIDVQKDVPFMLFAFSVPGGYVDGVRLFVNETDPGSLRAGMMDGDFKNTLQDYKSREFYRSSVDQAAVARLSEAVPQKGQPTLLVYPNPITGDAFTVTAKQFVAGERVKLQLYSSSSVELYAVEVETAQLVDYQIYPSQQRSSQAYLKVERTMDLPGPQAICEKLIILN